MGKIKNIHLKILNRKLKQEVEDDVEQFSNEIYIKMLVCY